MYNHCHNFCRDENAEFKPDKVPPPSFLQHGKWGYKLSSCSAAEYGSEPHYITCILVMLLHWYTNSGLVIVTCFLWLYRISLVTTEGQFLLPMSLLQQ